MALVTRAVTATAPNAGNGLVLFTWAAMDSDDDGTPVGLDPAYDYFVQLTGTLGTGGVLSMEGSFDGGTTYGILRDLGGNAVTLNAIGLIKHIYTYAPKIKPLCTAGDGSTSLVPILIGIRKLS